MTGVLLEFQVQLYPFLYLFLLGYFGGEGIVDQLFNLVACVGKAVVPKYHELVDEVNHLIALGAVEYGGIRFAVHPRIVMRVNAPFIIGIMQISSGEQDHIGT